ncbi:MerR family transcriptional regulator [Nevskia soli]|uniref:MerR family transcriptional regulator n=1 Tax=Nevskia soli TaxID=418856 RepID=UPI0004A75134|nr:MerR family transcriptional regulator [Nevskia soli]
MKIAAELLAPLPEIPRKRYFAIGEVSDLCAVKPHVLRYWEQEFPQLKPIKRRGNRRYYQLDDVLMVRHIRSLLYEQGFTIGGARQRLKDQPKAERLKAIQPMPVSNDIVVAAPPVSSSRKQKELHDIRSELENLLQRWPV